MTIDLSLVRTIPADNSYHETLFQIKKKAYGEYIEKVWGWNEKAERDFFAQDCQNLNPEIIMYRDQPIGSYCFTKNIDNYHLEHFYLLPDYQKKGIGSFILKSLLEISDKDRLPIKLMYLSFNPAASLYARMGFNVAGRQEIEGKQEYFIMAERKLGPASKPGGKYQAVIFDLFGTLIDNFSRSGYGKTLREMADIIGINQEKFVRLWFATFQERNTGILPTTQSNILYICRELKIDAADSLVEKAAEVRLNFTRRSIVPRPGTLETLSRLKAMRLKTALISDSSGEIPIVWKDTAMAPLFDVALFSCVVGFKKPDLRIYNLATDRLKVKPRNCLYVGDGGSNELTGARQAGMHPVLLRDPNETGDAHFVDRQETWDGPVISSIPEVLNLL